MLASISDALRTKLVNKETVVEILDTLQKMFGMQSEHARMKVTRTSKWKSSNKNISKPNEKDSKKSKKAKEQKHCRNSKGKCFHCDSEGH